MLLLEPVVHIEIHVPDSYVSDITGSPSSKRARIHGTDTPDGGELLIKAQVPLAEIADFQTELRSLTGGKGRCTIELSHDDKVPPGTHRTLIERIDRAPKRTDASLHLAERRQDTHVKHAFYQPQERKQRDQQRARDKDHASIERTTT